MTEVLLWIGVATTVLFGTVVAIEGARRPGYRWKYHTGSELELGEGGWIMRWTFVGMSVGMTAYAVAILDALSTVVGFVCLGAFAVGNLLSGVFTPDAVRGFPPRFSVRTATQLPSVHARIHDACGPLMFLALLGGCVAVSTALDGWLSAYSAVTAVIGFALMVCTAVAYSRDAALTGLVQRLLLAVYYVWIVVIGVSLAA
ncbi:DUF998 domain-containing protein [Gordonia sp. PKS22-38]|uniref:DUF998 domain-containing protein n=1 Tax=Gordonia prachuapensis TaxID=3115651 RepID=A0ABU7MND4_9ACTN|nr:DUF998 domain-containing protein [Gordonia sp. PKS22-38]